VNAWIYAYDADECNYDATRRVLIQRSVSECDKFTGKERDSESGLDNFDFRYYGSSLGRFMKADNGAAQDPANPQSWNLYSYVMNNPTTNVDPDGHDCIYFSSAGNPFVKSGDCISDKDSGIYVNGTVDQNSLHYNSDTQSWGYSYTAYDSGNIGAGTIAGAKPPGPEPPMDSGAVSPGLLGPGDFILLSGVKTPSFVTDALGKALGSIFGKTVEEAGAGVEEIVTKAGSSVGNQSIKATSRAAAEEAAEKWVGAGARPIFREGEQVGFVSADGTKVARRTSAGKPDPYINLTNNTTGGNLHVHF
jgi:RHS repeat-associated protein